MSKNITTDFGGGICRLISERLWNQPDKGELESHREETFIDDIVQKYHLERRLLSSLEGVETAFDGGAGCGRFSIPLAKHGIRVTHFDISEPMLEKARELAQRAGAADKITFVKGSLEDLSAYSDGEFDLVLSFDAPISYTYPKQNEVIRELIRIAKKRVLLSVSSRLGYLPYLANPIQKNRFILSDDSPDPFVKYLIENEKALVDGFSFDESALKKTLRDGLSGGEEEIREYENGGAPWPITYLFMPDELKAAMEVCGLTDIQMAGPGAYARTIPREILRKIMNDDRARAEFLDFSYVYDSNPYVLGMGKDNLFAEGQKRD